MSVNRGGSNWWTDTSPAYNSPGGATYGGGGGYGAIGVTGFRNELDARRSMAGPESQYPDGYLGTIIDRQQDKLLAKVQERLTDRSYQRGVHVGSKIGERQYFWNADMDPDMGLMREASTAQMDADGKIWVQKFAPTLDPVERLAHMGKTAGLSAPEQMQVARKFGVDPAKNPVVNPDPGRREAMQRFLPRYV